MSISQELKFPWGLKTCFQMYGTKRKMLHSGADQIQSISKRHCFVPSPLQEHGNPHSHVDLSNMHHQVANSQLSKRLMGCEDDDDASTTCKRTRRFITPDNESEMCDDVELSSETMQSTDWQQYSSSQASLTRERDWQHSSECRDFQHQKHGHEGEQNEMLACKRQHERAAVEHAKKLQSQIDFLQEIQSQSNDYWAIPQENQLKMADELEQARMAMDSDYVPDPYQYGCMPAAAAVPMAGPNAHTTVGQVRCYCKPNWEGVLEPMSYI